MNFLLRTISVVAALTVGTSAYAADIALQPSYKAGPMSMQTWTGAYIGGTAGYGWSDRSNSSVTAIDTIFMPFFLGAGSVPTSLNSRFKGFVGGGEAGYNWQSGRWVTGLEADLS